MNTPEEQYKQAGAADKPNRLDQMWVKRSTMLLFIDIIMILATYETALFLRFDLQFASIPAGYQNGFIHSMPYWIAATIIVFYVMRLYHSIWSFASINELVNIVYAYAVLLFVYAGLVIVLKLDMPRSYYCIGYVLSFCTTTAARFFYRFLRVYKYRIEATRRARRNTDDRIMIIGAGQAGRVLIREFIMSSFLNAEVCCVIDDDPGKKGRSIEGVPVVGGRSAIVENADKYSINRIIYAIPGADAQTKKEILNICKETNCKLQSVPGVYQLVNGEVNVSTLKDVEIQDLLGREQIKVNNQEVFNFIQGKVVMVTGGGGSIGSELSRQIAKNNPKLLIIFDIYENNAYDIQMELQRKYPDLNLEVLIGSVRNTNRVNWILNKYRPELIYHAAAHKHVPLMEDSPNETIKNNVMGTYKMAQAAAKYGVKRFVLISTDKAVNPTSIMGASKRLCEMVVQMMNRQSETEFVAVRFGNVLGSSGSVIPLFKKQIAEGGPVTVTHKDIIRFFMTIPEAVSLVLQASYYAKGGEIFILDMGEPVRIDDMARNLIRLSGYTPDVDIEIKYTGLRPGEKLYEEILMNEEGLQNTENKLIHIGEPIEMDDEWFKQKLKELDIAAISESPRMKDMVAEIIPTYHADHGNEKKEDIA